jgi:hypothetical protein
MQCPACQAMNPDDAKFCNKCGHSFAPVIIAQASNDPASTAPVLMTPASNDPAATIPVGTSIVSSPFDVPLHPVTPDDSVATWATERTDPNLIVPSVPSPPPPPLDLLARFRPRSSKRQTNLWIWVGSAIGALLALIILWVAIAQPSIQSSAETNYTDALQALQQATTSASVNNHQVVITDADVLLRLGTRTGNTVVTNVTVHFVANAINIAFDTWGIGDTIQIQFALQSTSLTIKTDVGGPAALALDGGHVTDQAKTTLQAILNHFNNTAITAITLTTGQMAITLG